jgi:hypothetical protein
LTTLVGLAQHGATYAAADMIASSAIWAIALVTLVLIFMPQSSRYYRQAAQQAAHS